jgi:hypothetical protein
MKKGILLIVLLTLNNIANAQCVSNPSLFTNVAAGNFVPLANDFSTDVQYNATVGQNYSVVLNYKTITDTTFGGLAVKIKKTKLIGVTGAPVGTTITPDQPDSTWENAGTYPNLTSVYGCVNLSIPGSSLNAAGIYNMVIELDWLMNIAGQEIWYSALPPPLGTGGYINYPGYDLQVLGSSCNYSLSNTSYSCSNNTSASYNNISSVTTTSGCSWAAAVTSGNAWLTCTSSGTGNGNISISVTANTSSNSRTGTINVNGQTLTVTQPGNCSFSLSNNSYTCANNASATYNNISTVTTNSGCSWIASVTSGNSWLTCTSSATGNGSISISVLTNSGSNARTGTIDINGQTITVIQPSSCSTSLSISAFNCPDETGTTYSNIAIVNTSSGCPWAAVVTSGNAWMSTQSSGNGQGFVSILVTVNTTSSDRIGTIDVNGQTLTVTQPGVCSLSLSNSVFDCADASGTQYTNVVIVNTPSSCAWTATVTSGSAWLSTSSSGTGQGFVSLLVAANTVAFDRTGTVSINDVTLTVNQPGTNLGVMAIDQLGFSVMPNPAKDWLIINNAKQLNNCTYCLVNMLGEKMICGSISNNQELIQIETLAKGVYFLKIDGKDKQLFKVIKE